MDPVTHATIGLAVSKITGNGIDPNNPICLAIVAGSVFPDIDIIFQKWGDYTYLKNHRGITHSIVGLLLSAIVITTGLAVFYRSSNLLTIYFAAFAGGLLHTIADLFNNYGAKLLWPFYKKMISFKLFMSFDPIFLTLLVGYVTSKGNMELYFLSCVIAYFFMRLLMRSISIHKLQKHFGDSFDITIMPSMVKLFKWHIILEDKECSIVLEKNAFRTNMKLCKKLDKLNDEDLEFANISPVGKFFDEFTHTYHIYCEDLGDTKKYVFVDMRYFYKDNFLHHAVLEVDGDSKDIVNSTFNAYKIDRECSFPVGKYV